MHRCGGGGRGARELARGGLAPPGSHQGRSRRRPRELAAGQLARTATGARAARGSSPTQIRIPQKKRRRNGVLRTHARSGIGANLSARPLNARAPRGRGPLRRQIRRGSLGETLDPAGDAAPLPVTPAPPV
ncbi:hypothetical protein C2845_PM07G13560 [Panicum miliaceum]|uniref:Uncharacterized protein n=1 Tax=Panicum miliaceum TaxID=4540 RepID=A0A3L6SIZ7_PANMI|nr:hypothetical protein C2845_PM07G13560 [Panicum miliaceum]